MLSDVKHYVPDGNGGYKLAFVSKGKDLSEKMYKKFREGKQLRKVMRVTEETQSTKTKKKCLYEECGKEFETFYPQAKFCPKPKGARDKDTCRYKHDSKTRKRSNKKALMDCVVCGKEFMADRENARYCHSPCDFNTSNLKNHAPKSCVICGGMFKPFRLDAVYCHEPCNNHSRHNIRGAIAKARASIPKCYKPVLIDNKYHPSFPQSRKGAGNYE